MGVGGAPWGPGGTSSPPFWSLTNIKGVAADIMCGAADISCGAADILRGVAEICLPKTHFFPFLKIFLSVLDFFKGKNTLFSKNSQKLV